MNTYEGIARVIVNDWKTFIHARKDTRGQHVYYQVSEADLDRLAERLALWMVTMQEPKPDGR